MPKYSLACQSDWKHLLSPGSLAIWLNILKNCVISILNSSYLRNKISSNMVYHNNLLHKDVFIYELPYKYSLILNFYEAEHFVASVEQLAKNPWEKCHDKHGLYIELSLI